MKLRCDFGFAKGISGAQSAEETRILFLPLPIGYEQLTHRLLGRVLRGNQRKESRSFPRDFTVWMKMIARIMEKFYGLKTVEPLEKALLERDELASVFKHLLQGRFELFILQKGANRFRQAWNP